MNEEPLNLGGLHLPHDKERKIVIVAAVITILLLVWTWYKSKTASSDYGYVSDLYGTGTTAGSGVTGSTTTTNTVETEQWQDTYQTVEYKFTTDASNLLKFGSQKGSASGGGGGLNVFGLFSVGGGGGKTGQTNYAAEAGYSNLFTSDVTVHGDAATIKGVQEFLTNLVGSATQRAQTQYAAEQQAIDFSKTLAGVK